MALQGQGEEVGTREYVEVFSLSLSLLRDFSQTVHKTGTQGNFPPNARWLHTAQSVLSGGSLVRVPYLHLRE